MPRHYLMCPPIHYTVSYEINPWMNVRVATDAQLAMTQWERLRQVYQELGHTVDVLDPLPQYPDMVYAANGATVIDGIAYGAKVRHNERADRKSVVEGKSVGQRSGQAASQRQRG